jgi:hypothetical protein
VDSIAEILKKFPPKKINNQFPYLMKKLDYQPFDYQYYICDDLAWPDFNETSARAKVKSTII